MKEKPTVEPASAGGLTPVLKASWYAFEVEEFPPACQGRIVRGMLYEQVDAVAAGCISTFLKTGALDDECLAMLDDTLVRLLEMAAASPDADERAYFTRLGEIGLEVRAAARPAP